MGSSLRDQLAFGRMDDQHVGFLGGIGIVCFAGDAALRVQCAGWRRLGGAIEMYVGESKRVI